MRLIWILIIIMFFTISTYARPSWCSSSKLNRVERRICDSSELGNLENKITKIYSNAKGKLSGYKKRDLVQEERAWIKERNSVCKHSNDNCIKRYYLSRIEELKQYYFREEKIVRYIEPTTSILSTPIKRKQQPNNKIDGQEKKVALLIGNRDYIQKDLQLSSPIKDIEAISEALISIGFEVIPVENGSKEAIKKSLREFDTQAQKADIALIYYSGHGLQAFDIDNQKMENYIIPIDADVQTLGDLDELIKLNQLIYYSYGSDKTKSIVLIDACRDNPLYAKFREASKSGTYTKGLAQPVTNRQDILIGFATQSNRVAKDGQGDLSPYAQAIRDNITKNIDIRIVLGKVREDVLQNTENSQEPETISKLGGTEVCLSGACR